MNITEIQKLKYTNVGLNFKKFWERGFESHQETLLQYFHIAFSPVDALRIGESSKSGS
jgi:hypothetical protein